MCLILVIEDDPRLQRALQRQFTAEGYEVHVEGRGPDGLAAFKRLNPVAVVLDLMLPEMSGRIICKEIRATTSEVPIIILSAVTEVADKVLLLETGADDYVTKPFSPRELLARVQVAIRKNRKKQEPKAASFGDVSIDLLKMEVRKAGRSITLTAHEFKLLRYFIENAGRAINRDELLSDVWDLNFHLTTRTVDNQILKLRRKLESDPAEPIHFLTLRGVGYKFVPEASPAVM